MTNFPQRLQRFQAHLEGKADLAFFPISADLHYLTGVPRDIPNFGWSIHPGEWLEGAWITPGKDAVLTLPRMSAEFGGLDKLGGVDIRVLGDHDAPEGMMRKILADLGIPQHGARVAVGDRARGETTIALQKLLPGVMFSSATDLLRPQRMIKDADEIALMRKAGAITEAAFADVLPKLRIGMTELEILAEVDFQMRRHGALGPSFTTSLYNSGPQHPLIFGEREKTWQRAIGTQVSVLFDFGAALDGMCYDFGRTVSFGAPSAEQQRVYDVMMASQAAGVAALKAGEMTCEQVDAVARAVIETAGFGAEFRHRLGHGIGMDVHEPPFLTKGDTTLLQEGMLFTIEPSIMQFNGFSARVEDVVVARPSGGEKLTNGWQELIVVE